MPDILVRNLKPETVAWLKKRAADHRRSLQAEVATLLEDAAGQGVNPNADFLVRASELRASIDPSVQTDSTEMIREARDSDHGHEW